MQYGTMSQALNWAANGERGVSSNTIFAVMTNTVDKDRKDAWHHYSYPHDPSDFIRCMKLLKTVPAWRHRLRDVVDVFPEWEKLVERWDEIEAMIKAESPSGKYSKAYEMIRACLEDVRKDPRRIVISV